MKEVNDEEMSQDNTNGAGTKRTPKQLGAAAGKWGGIVTAILIACQVLTQILHPMP